MSRHHWAIKLLNDYGEIATIIIWLISFFGVLFVAAIVL